MKANPTTDDLALTRAAEIHAEGRSVFVYGPPPYRQVVKVAHRPTGKAWTVKISAHLDREGIAALAKLIDSASQAENPETMPFGLAYLTACSEVIGGQSARQVRE